MIVGNLYDYRHTSNKNVVVGNTYQTSVKRLRQQQITQQLTEYGKKVSRSMHNSV